MDLKDIKAIIELMKKNSLSEFEMEKDGFRIYIKRNAAGVEEMQEEGKQVSANIEAGAAPAAQTKVSAPKTQISTDTLRVGTAEVEIKSPMVGTFYRAPAPDAPPYVDIGSEVNPETVVCIIEAMKVMNEIKAEVTGVITEILVENGAPVEFGQPLFKVRLKD